MGAKSSRERRSHDRSNQNPAPPSAHMPPYLAAQFNNQRPAINNGNDVPATRHQQSQQQGPPLQQQQQQQQQQQTPTTGNNDVSNNNNHGNNGHSGRGNQRGVQEGQIVKMMATVDASSVVYNPGTHMLQFTITSVCPSLTYEIHTGVKEFIKEGEVVYMPNKPKMEPPRISLQGTQENKVIKVAVDVSMLDDKELSYNKHYPKQQPCVIVLRYQSNEMCNREDQNADAASRAKTLEHTEHTAVDLAANPKRRVISQIVTASGSAYVVENLFGVDGETLGVTNGHPEVMLGATIVSHDGDEDEDGLCVICLTLPKDTAVMPCRHMCLCESCAEELLRHTPKCPVCRCSFSTLLRMPVLNGGK